MTAPSLPHSDPAVTLARIEVKLDTALAQVDDHEKRLRALESRTWPRQSMNLWISACASVCAIAVVVEGLLIR